MALPRQRLSFYKGFLWDYIVSFFRSETGHINSFEKAFSERYGREAIFMSSGRMALYYILESMNLKEGDEIIVPAYTYYAVPAVIAARGYSVVFVDIDEGLGLDVKKLKQAITSKTKAIIATHLFGSLDIEKICSIGKKHKIPIIEDCAQSLGTTVKGKRVGTFGDYAFFSFSHTKLIKTFCGSMALVRNKRAANKIREAVDALSIRGRGEFLVSSLCTCVQNLMTKPLPFNLFVYPFLYFTALFSDRDYLYDILNEKYNLRDYETMKFKRPVQLQGKMGLKQFFDLEERVQKQQVKILPFIKAVEALGYTVPSYTKEQSFKEVVILVKNRSSFAQRLVLKGIDVQRDNSQAVPYMKMFHMFKKEEYPVALRVSKEIIQLPVYYDSTEKELKKILRVLSTI